MPPCASSTERSPSCARCRRPRAASRSSATSATRCPLAALVFGLVGFPARDPLPPRRAQHRVRRQPGHPRHVLPAADVARGRRRSARGSRAAVAIWTPNVLFASVGLGLLRDDRAGVAAARDAARLARRSRPAGAPLPSRGPAARPRHGGGTGRDSTHIIDRYLVREYLAFMGLGLAVAAALFVMIDLLQTLDRYLRLKPPLPVHRGALRLPVAGRAASTACRS